jgi:hypothetical protein
MSLAQRSCLIDATAAAPASPCTTELDDTDSESDEPTTPKLDSCVLPIAQDLPDSNHHQAVSEDAADPLYDLLCSPGSTSCLNWQCDLGIVPGAPAQPGLPEIAVEPEVDMDELLQLYPLNNADNGPCLEMTSRIVIRHKVSSEPAESNDGVEKVGKPKAQIQSMSLEARRFAMKQMVADMPDGKIQWEAEARLSYVVGNCNVLLMQNKAQWCFIQQAAELQRHFYIGITERPAERFRDHQADGFSTMALWIYEDSRWSAAAEKALIREHRGCQLMLNIGQGGERRSAAKPHFLYVVLKKPKTQRK